MAVGEKQLTRRCCSYHRRIHPTNLDDDNADYDDGGGVVVLVMVMVVMMIIMTTKLHMYHLATMHLPLLVLRETIGNHGVNVPG